MKLLEQDHLIGHEEEWLIAPARVLVTLPPSFLSKCFRVDMVKTPPDMGRHLGRWAVSRQNYAPSAELREFMLILNRFLVTEVNILPSSYLALFPNRYLTYKFGV